MANLKSIEHTSLVKMNQIRNELNRQWLGIKNILYLLEVNNVDNSESVKMSAIAAEFAITQDNMVKTICSSIESLVKNKNDCTVYDLQAYRDLKNLVK
jgi:hypothetical protein